MQSFAKALKHLTSAKNSAKRRGSGEKASDPASIQKLQRTAGNQATLQLLETVPYLGPARIEMILALPATAANAAQRVAALVRAAKTLDPSQAKAMRERLGNSKSRIGARFKRLSTESRNRILSTLDAQAVAKPTPTPAPAAKPGNESSSPAGLTPEQEYEGERAYYESTRQARLDARERREAEVRSELPGLSAQDIWSRWKEDGRVFAAVANTPKHGLTTEQMLMIYRRYWGERRDEGAARRLAIARREANENFGRYFDKINRYYNGELDAMGPESAQAKYDEDFGDLALAAVVDAKEFLIAAENAKRTLTLDELTKFATDKAKVRLQVAAGMMAWGAMGRGIRSARPVQGKQPTPRGSVNGRPTDSAAGEIKVPQRGSVNGRPATTAAGETTVPQRGDVNGRPTTTASGKIVAPGPGTRAKPRVATPTEYWWANPGMKKGNFIKAEFENGRLTVTVKAHGPNRRSGSQLLDDVFNHFGNKNIKEFESQWVRNSSFKDNYDEFMRNLNRGMSETEAAWNTWTGRQLKARGFTRVEVPPHGRDWVSPVFRK